QSVSASAPILLSLSSAPGAPRSLHSFPTRRSSDLPPVGALEGARVTPDLGLGHRPVRLEDADDGPRDLARSNLGADGEPAELSRSEEHTSELQSRENLVCRLLLEKKKPDGTTRNTS